MCFLCSCDQLTSVCRLGVWGTSAKWLMLFGNFAQSFLGPIFVGLGLASYVLKAQGNTEWVTLSWWSTPIMVTGCFIYLLTMTGFIAAYKELKYLACLYAIVMAVVLVGQGIMWWYGLGNVDERIKIWIRWAFEEPKWREYFNVAESVMFCCGVDGAVSYQMMHMRVPPSCCDTPIPVENNSTMMTCNTNHTYIGCADVAPAFVQNLTDTIGGDIYYVFGVELVDLISSVVLFLTATS